MVGTSLYTTSAHSKSSSDHQPLCVRPGVDDTRRSKHLLARTIIIRHLLIHLTDTAPTVQVNIFPSLSSQEFRKYLDIEPLHFVMSHDGAMPTIGKVIQESKWDGSARMILRSNIWYFNDLGLNVALINRIEFRDSKVKRLRRMLQTLTDALI